MIEYLGTSQISVTFQVPASSLGCPPVDHPVDEGNCATAAYDIADRYGYEVLCETAQTALRHGKDAKRDQIDIGDRVFKPKGYERGYGKDDCQDLT